ncbi:MAG: hypothetical protein II206_06970, partial [Bacteroidaceae bacterium]|nr:hypothetical protein [Bacteroidaceae bacterium]
CTQTSLLSPLTAHRSPLTAQKSVSYVLLSNPFGGIGGICVSKNLGRCTQTSLPLHRSSLTAHLLFVKKHEKGFLG